MSQFVDRRTATPDPPPKGIPNPIHDDEGADGAGYAGALVAGVRTYGWAAQTILRALGDAWLADGWVDFTLKRPLYSGDELVVTFAEQAADWALTCTRRSDADDEPRVVLAGRAGLGEAPWSGELAPPPATPAMDPPAIRPTFTLDTIPLRTPLRPLGVTISEGAARRLANDDLDVADDRFTGPEPLIHPYFIAARMAPLTRHNFTFGPTIHVRSQIQHRHPAAAPQDLTVCAEIVDAYERNGHRYQVLDGRVTGSSDGDIALIRHHTIFQPRGTELPPPIVTAELRT